MKRRPGSNLGDFVTQKTSMIGVTLCTCLAKIGLMPRMSVTSELAGGTLDTPAFSKPLTASEQEDRFVISAVIVNPEPFSQHDHVEVLAVLMLKHISPAL